MAAKGLFNDFINLVVLCWNYTHQFLLQDYLTLHPTHVVDASLGHFKIFDLF